MRFKFGLPASGSDAVEDREVDGKGSGSPTQTGRERPVDLPEILPYLAPIFAYVALGGLESYLPRVDQQPSARWYPIAYAVRVVIVGAIAWWYRETWKDLRPFPSIGRLALAIVTGLVVVGLWVGLDGHYPALPFMNQRVAFDAGRLPAGARWGFIAVRMLGLVILVPLIEELFWRSFLMRWLIDQEFTRVSVGRVTPIAAVLTSLLFATAHPEWLPALLTGFLWAWLLWQTKSLGACVASHAVANLALGIYVIASGDWKYW
ncbi:MAG: CAAX prenyl protease-related protein [Isosphaeraceae bacterium]